MKQRLGQAIDMNVSILTSGYWPSYPLYEARLPDELTRHQQVFKVGAVSICLHMLRLIVQVILRSTTLFIQFNAAANRCGELGSL